MSGSTGLKVEWGRGGAEGGVGLRLIGAGGWVHG